jgi:hypothetical protein
MSLDRVLEMEFFSFLILNSNYVSDQMSNIYKNVSDAKYRTKDICPIEETES